MRLFPILAALAVSLGLYIVIFEREWALSQLSPPGTDAAPQNTAETVEPVPEPQGTDLVKVVVARIQAEPIQRAVILRGETTAARQVEVRSETSAIVASEPLRKGAFVEAGQAMCKLDAGTRQSALQEARARLAEAESRVPESEARVAEAVARLDEAKINQNASARLNADGFASTTRLANADAAVAAAEASLSSAKAGLRAARAGIESAQASVASAEKEISRLEITAPFAGILESDTAELGTLLQPGALCATIIQLNPIKLVGFVPETEVNRVDVGSLAGARLAAGGQEVQGRVTFLSRSADPTTRTFRVEIDVPNEGLSIRDGQTAEIAISAEGTKAHLVPQSALTLDDDGVLGLRLIDEDASVVFTPVSVIRDTTKGIWVEGLPQIADVIVVGQEFVTAGVTVAPTFRELSQ